VVLGDSDAVRVGEPVFAIGNPFEQQFSVTTGIISGVNRDSESSFTNRAIRGVLQTDAALNPGNSGGPLFNGAGEVIGINASITTPPGTGARQPFFIGLGFAIPSNTASRFLPELIAGETIRHTQLGIAGEELDELDASDAGVDIDRGIYLTDVAPGTAAANAGLREGRIRDGGRLLAGGDVILAIDGVETNDFASLATIIDRHDVGDEVTLSVYRDGETVEIEVTLLEWR
jgi:S1-C subfamily serine protease